ncbi:MAG: hypothetical protein RIG84_05740 [Roseovarius sp.]
MGEQRGHRWLLLPMAALCLALSLLYSFNPISKGAEGYAGRVASASAVVYVSLRTLNAFLSTAQEAEVGLSVGASASFQPLKTLEPIDDTIERIAAMVFGMMVVSGVLSVATGPIGAIGFAMAGLGLVSMYLSPRIRVGRKLLLYGAFLAIALPLSYWISGGLAEVMTGQKWDENQRIVNEIVKGVETTSADTNDEGWFAEFFEQGDAVKRYTTLATRIASEADTLIKSYIELLAVLVFNLILLPLILIGGVFVLFRWLANDAWE